MSLKSMTAALLTLPMAGALQAQAIKNEPPMRHFTDEEVAAIKMPVLAFEERESDTADYDKYFYFHRPDTSFDEAYADVMECDALSSGVNIYVGADSSSMASAMTNYGMLAGAAGGVIASVLMDAIIGSGERRKQRRENIRNCMFYKGYDRYGLAKSLWQQFNFEEGNGREEAKARNRDLMTQARVASGAKPQQEVLVP